MFKVLNRLTLLCLFFAAHVTPAQSPEDARSAAFTALPDCDQAVTFDSNYLATSRPGAGRSTVVRVTTVAQPSHFFEVTIADRVVDLKVQNGFVYVLTQQSISVWNLEKQTQTLESVSHPNLNSHWRTFASGFILQGDRVLISHGTLGVSVLNLKTRQFEKLLAMPTVSSAQDITMLNEETALLAIDNDDEGTFRGVYVLDLKRLEFSRRVSIDNAFPSAIRVLDNSLMLVFSNAIWKFDLNEILTEKKPQPVRRAWKLPGLALTDIIGKMAFDQKHVYGCFKIHDEKTGQIVGRKPLVYSLETLKLN